MPFADLAQCGHPHCKLDLEAGSWDEAGSSKPWKDDFSSQPHPCQAESLLKTYEPVFSTDSYIEEVLGIHSLVSFFRRELAYE